MWTLPHQLRRQVAARPDEPFVQFGDADPYTYRDVLARSEDAAARLAQLGVGRGDMLQILAPTSPEMVFTWFGASLLCAVDVTLNTSYRAGPLVHALNLCQGKVLVVDAECLPRLVEVEDDLTHLETVVVIRPAGERPTFRRLNVVELSDIPPADQVPDEKPCYPDITSIIFTSGTTGPAKGVRIPHAQMFVYAQQHISGFEMTADDVFYCFHPMFHIGGKGALYSTVLAGGRVVVRDRFAPEAWLDDIRKYRATLTIGHGPMLEMIFAQPERPEDSDNQLRALMACPFPTAIAERFEARFGVKGVEVFGTTECTTPVWRSLREPLRLGSCGRPSNDVVEVLIVDPETREEVPAGQAGEIVVRPLLPWVLMQGYLGNPEATVEAWDNYRYNTGDGGRFDKEGYLYFLDRMKDRIRRRAENIASYDIESAACSFDGVLEAAAVGVPSGYQSDDDIKLCVVAATPIDHAQLLEHLATELPHYMVPRYIEVLGELPRTPTNKVRKQVLREQNITPTTWDRHESGISLRELVSEIEAKKT
jgi:crotonobetaine/carnitine-CoA ligase